MSKVDFIKRYEDAWNTHDIDEILSFFAKEFAFEDVPIGLFADSTGKLRQILQKTFKEVPDFSMKVQNMLEGPSFVVTEWRQSGTATGEVEGASVASKRYSVRATSIIEFNGSK